MRPSENELETLLAEWLHALHTDVYHLAAIVPTEETRAIVTLWQAPPPPPADLEVPQGAIAIFGALRQIHTPKGPGEVQPLPRDGFCGLAVTPELTVKGFYGLEWAPGIEPDEGNASLEWVVSRYTNQLHH